MANGDGSAGLLQYTHWCILLAVFVAAIVFKPSSDLAEVPGDVPGAPVIGHTLEIMRDGDGMQGWIAERCETYGTASRIFLMGSDIVLLCGHIMAKEVFTNEELVESVDGNQVGVLGGGGPLLPLPHMTSTKSWSPLHSAINKGALAAIATRSFRSKLRDGARRKMYPLVELSLQEGSFDPGEKMKSVLVHSLIMVVFGKWAALAPPEDFLDPYVAAIEDYFSCTPMPPFVPMSCFRRAIKTFDIVAIPWMVTWISKARRQANYGVVDALVFNDDAEHKDASDEEIALAIHDWFLEQIPPAKLSIAVALSEEAGMKAKKFESGSGLFDEDGKEIGLYMEPIIAEATRVAPVTSFSIGQAKQKLMLRAVTPNRDCHKDCPSCTSPCEPKEMQIGIPAGTRLMMAWHTVHVDAALFPDPLTFNPERPVTKDEVSFRGAIYESLDYLPRGPRTSSCGAVAAATIAKTMNEQFDFDRNATTRAISNFQDNGRFKG